MVIQRSDRVAEVLKRDERMIETFIAASPVFNGLRNPLMRRTMGRLATVEQAARVAGVDPDALVAQLNHASGARPGIAGAAGSPPVAKSRAREEESMSPIDAGFPPALARIPAGRVVDLDVREDLRNGQEPFSRIMAARREVPPGGALRLRAIFEPAPLYAVMAKQGFDHWTEQLAEDDWRVWFYPADTIQEPPPSPIHPVTRSPVHPVPGAEVQGAEEEIIVLDVRGMEPPEPLVRTLAALEELAPGKTLLQINERVPQFLLPKLEELGFTYQLREQSDALIRVFIRRRVDS